MKHPDAIFDEKQYLGFNKYSLLRRIVIAVFCLCVYYFTNEFNPTPNKHNPSRLLFFIGIAILIGSLLMVYVLHIRTTLINNNLILDGLWTARRIIIDLKDIQSVKFVSYDKSIFNRPVYNLHISGEIKFYTRGNEAVKLTDKEGKMYLIGSQKAGELLRAIELVNQPTD